MGYSLPVNEARLRRVGRYLIVAAIVGVLAVQYVRAIGPSAIDQRAAACHALDPTPFSSALAKLPSPAPALSLRTLDGAEVTLAGLRGRAVLVNFWLPSCEPCEREMPSMETLATTLAPEGVSVLAVAEAPADAVRAFFPHGTPLQVLLDRRAPGQGAGEIAHRFGTEKYPESYLIDRRGVVRYYFVNQRDWASAQALACVRSILEEN